jgi:multiple sugar transport system permease protein
MTSDPMVPRARIAPRARAGQLARWLLLAVLCVISAFPLLLMLSSAFKPLGEIFDGSVLPHHPTARNFAYVFVNVPLLRYLFNSAFTALAVTAIALWFHSMAGYALARLRFPGREVIFTTVFSTLLFSLPIILVPLVLVTKFLHLNNTYWALIIPPVFNGFGIFFMRQCYLAFPSELEDAARVDGCGYWRFYRRIVVPMSVPVLTPLGILIFLATWNAFLWPLTVINSPNLVVVQVGIANFQGQYSAPWNDIMAASVVAAVPTLLLFWVFQRRLTQTIKLAGLK